ncbi:LysR family transcriptional regulator [Lysobacter solisilvae (ex Woo and Kim 2020)]|uniref:LysR family transcriptional regulator n=1 Tax=Agrilutibacter terrestris TaxID=2865112 RepID=A0A7H0FU11_9GAMM|nr:LysR family transcriptional regulator [Lysobacter terrestris]QNP39527.1 LysR family transcriptional regulator [Lysobacter terrestris]
MEFDWNDIPLLLKLAGTGSMSQAGRALGLDASTVSRRVAAAEKALQARLFIREPVGYRATDAGRVFLAHAEAVHERVQTMLLDVRAEAEGIAGTVNVTAIDVLFTHWLVRHLPQLLDAHPALQVNLLGDNRDLSFTRREADLAIRLNRPSEDAALRMRKVGALGFAVYGAGAYANLPREQWADAPWLAYPVELSRMPEMQWLAQLQPRRPLVRLSSVSMILRACEEGAGLALLPCIAADRAGLQRLHPDPVLSRELWLLSHRDAGQIVRFRVVADWLAGLFETEAAALRGEIRT